MYKDDKHVQGKPQDAVNRASGAIFDNLTFQVAHARKICADACLEDAESPEEEVFVASDGRCRETGADDEEDAHEDEGGALAAVLACE